MLQLGWAHIEGASFGVKPPGRGHYPEWFARLIDDCMIEDGVLRVVTGVWLRLYRPTGKVTYIDVWDGSPAAEGGPYQPRRQWDPNPDDPEPF